MKTSKTTLLQSSKTTLLQKSKTALFLAPLFEVFMFKLAKYAFISLCILILLQVKTYANEKNAHDILRASIEHSSAITNIYTKFSQEKFLDFLDEPIHTGGILFFDKTKPYTLFWEYSKPSLSGIFYDKNKTYVWTQSRENVREPQAHEKNFTHIMIEQLMFWLNIDISSVQNNYEIEKVSSFELRLLPKKKDFFQFITIKFTNDYKRLENLTFFESATSYTRLIFSETLFNSDKKALFSYDELFGKELSGK